MVMVSNLQPAAIYIYRTNPSNLSSCLRGAPVSSRTALSFLPQPAAPHTHTTTTHTLCLHDSTAQIQYTH